MGCGVEITGFTTAIVASDDVSEFRGVITLVLPSAVKVPMSGMIATAEPSAIEVNNCSCAVVRPTENGASLATVRVIETPVTSDAEFTITSSAPAATAVN